jgi:Protein of unknown function (DUF4038)/Domain of unknown function (DUF5060)
MKGISRRHFCQTSSLLMAGLAPVLGAAPDPIRAIQYEAMEWSYTSRKAYPDPFNEVELDVVVTHSDGREQRVPAFWAGEQNWTVRFSPYRTGRYSYRTICSDPSNGDLHGRTGSFEAVTYSGDHPLYRHGPVKVAPDQRHFQHADGTPFFWLGDTWWMAFCQRLRWPEDFQTLTADRIRKGFTVIQIVAGLYPDMPQFDPRGANEAGYPWERDLSRINPSYFDMADLRLRYLARQGLVPCVVGGWGYYLPILGEKKIKQHWRYLIARWGAYPTIWCLAGEGTMPYYLSENKERDKALQKTGWTAIARYLRSMDPYGHPITIHPSDTARNTVDDPAVLDFDMLQTGHSDRNSIPNTVRRVTESLQHAPKMPVINGEVCYEGIAEASRQEVQRFMFWACVLSGAAGHTYGANGIWQINTLEKPYGPSPHGRSWGDTPWQEAYQLPGSRQLGLAKALLARFAWWKMEPHPEWVEPHWTAENYQLPYAAGIPGELRIVFIPTRWDPPKVNNLEAGVSYRAFFFNCASGKEIEIGKVQADSNGDWQIPTAPIFQDWVVVMESEKNA